MKKNTVNNPTNAITNAFSIDVEGFIESNVQSFNIPSKYIDQAKENCEIERNMVVLLELLDETNTKATFFIVGRIAYDIPQVVRKIAQAGHEIGCHNFEHLRVFGVAKNVFREKIKAAKNELEDISGQKVYGFRAPDFSITKDSIWALDILKELGFVYDSSIYPIGLHDVYGIKDAEASIHRFPNGLIEFPMSTIEIFGKRIPFGGGGYFRLYPLWLTKIFLSKVNKQGHPCMLYIHPYEVGPVIPKVSELSAYRKFRHYYNCENGQKRLKNFFKLFELAPAINILRQLNLFEG